MGAGDRTAGLPLQEQRFPPGSYGHADYVLGYHQNDVGPIERVAA
jgi:hypothetical protein